MYNEDVKKRFVEESTSSRISQDAMVRLFDDTAPYEETWGADICTRSEEDVQGIIDKVSGGTSGSRRTQISILKKYGRWCISAGISGASRGILSIDQFDGGLDKVRQQMVSNPIQLQAFLDAVFAPEDLMTYDNIYRVYCWLHYMGIPKDKVIQIDASCVDFDKSVLSLGGRDYEIYAASIPAFRNVVCLNSFMVGREGSFVEMRRREGSNILRGIRSSSNDKTILHQLSVRLSSASNNDSNVKSLNYTRIRQSGVFFRMFQREIRGFDVDFTEISIEELQDKGYETSGSVLTCNRVYKYAWKYKKEYERWKLAFSL